MIEENDFQLPCLFNVSFVLNKCSNLSSMLNEKGFLNDDHKIPDFQKVFYGNGDVCKMGWNDSGIAFELFTGVEPKSFHYLRLFFNVRKSTIYESSNKFCHIFEFKLASHFKPWFLLSEKLEGSICNKKVQSSFGAIFYTSNKKDYSIRCWIGIDALSGYDPYEFSIIGFSYSYIWGSDEEKALTGGVDIETPKPICWSEVNLKQELV